MEVVNLASNSVPLSTSYVGDEDVKFRGYKNITEEGIDMFQEEYLRNISDIKINNYSSIYLTNKTKLDDILDLTVLPKFQEYETFNTTIIDNNTGLYLTISSVSAEYFPVYFKAVEIITPELPFYFSKIDEKFIDPTNRMFEIQILDDIHAKIIHRSKTRHYYYLNYINSNFVFNLSSNDDTSVFNYILDKTNGNIALFKTIITGSIENVYSIILNSNNTLELSPSLNEFSNNCFKVNYYIQELSPKLNTSWVSYNTDYSNQYEVNPKKSRSDLSNNYMIYSQYSYLTGDTISTNLLTLKNQKTHKNYNYRSDYMESAADEIPVVDNRTYNGLFTGNNQEKGDSGITLSYEFYNADYKFLSDKYTIFITPESIYPYTQININDLKWNIRGSIAGENPYMSDKIYQKTVQSGTADGEYLCSWLYKNRDGSSIWLDRYYHPQKTTYAKALETTFNYTLINPLDILLNTQLQDNEYYDVPDIYNTLEEEYINTPQTVNSALYGRSYFDKRSDLVILPNSEYIYHRIGNEYVKDVIKTIEEFIIQNGLGLKDFDNFQVTISSSDIDSEEYIFNNGKFATIQNNDEVNKSHQMTISFWLQNNDWSKKIGHQIFGNLNDKGISLYSDEKITPLITIQNDKSVYIFNTNFEQINISSLRNEGLTNSIIKDLYRTDHLDSMYTITTNYDSADN